MERPKIGYCQRIDLAPNVLLVDTAKLHELIEWSVWAEQELSKLHQPTVIGSDFSVAADINLELKGTIDFKEQRIVFEKIMTKAKLK